MDSLAPLIKTALKICHKNQLFKNITLKRLRIFNRGLAVIYSKKIINAAKELTFTCPGMMNFGPPINAQVGQELDVV